MDFSPENIRKRFHELTETSQELHATLDPLREELADLVAGNVDLSAKDARKREEKVRELIVAANEELFPIEQERALCARALGGRTGEPAEEA